jgi:hypothetical protein
VGLIGAVVELLVQPQCAGAERQGLLVVAEPTVVPADVGERDRLSDPVAGGLEQPQSPFRGVERVGVAALQPIHKVAVVVRPGLPGGVADLAGQLEGATEVEVCVVERPRSA